MTTNILTSGQYFRLSTAYVARGLRRALPLLEANKVFISLTHDTMRVILFGGGFASGFPRQHGDALAELRPVANRIDQELSNAPLAISSTAGAARALTHGMMSVVEGLVARELGLELKAGSPDALFDRARQEVREAVSWIENALHLASTGEGHLVAAALRADENACERHRDREDDRLGRKGAWLGPGPISGDVLGPPLEPSEGGPLGLLWPDGAPSRYRDDVKLPVIVAARDFISHPTYHPGTTDVVWFSDDPDVEHFFKGAAEFLAAIEAASPNGRRPQCHIYLPDQPSSDPALSRGLAVRLAALGATVWHTEEFDGPRPASSEALAAEIQSVYRKTVGRRQLLALNAAQQLALAGNGATPPSIRPPAPPPVAKPGVNEPGWEKSGSAQAYRSVAAQSRTEEAGG